MDLDMSVHRSRRTVIGAALGAVAASVAQAIGRPDPILAGSDGDVVLGTENRSTAQTSILNDDAASAATAFLGWTYGTGVGVAARSLLGPGLRAESSSATGPGMIGASRAHQTGVIGASLGPSSVEPTSVAPVGLFGYAEDGDGVRGITTTAAGVGGRFVAPIGGTGLLVTGRARFDRSGLANVPKRRQYVDVTVPGGLVSTSLVIATLQTYRPGVAVSSVRKNYPSAGKARIYLTKVASSSAATSVGWIAIG